MFKLFGSKARKESTSPEVVAKFEQARALSQLGQLAEAAAICRGILELQGEHVDSLMLCAEIATRQRDPERAIQLYSRITQVQPRYVPAHYKRGNVLKDCGQLEAAVASYDRAVALDPGHANAFCNRGTVLEGLHRLDAALASYDQAVALNPADALAYYNRGTLLRRLGRSAEALASYDQAIAAKSDYAEAYFNRGILLTELQRSKEALASYERAIEIAPGFARAHFRRGALLFAMKQFDAALASFDKAIEINPRFAEAYSYRGALLQETQQLDAALASYNKAIEIDPGHAEAYYNRGVLLQERKQADAALADYDKAIAIIPHFVEAHSNRGALLYAQKQFDAALASYDKAIELDPKYADAFLNRGILLMRLRKNGALASLDRAVALAPACVDAHFYRAQTLILMKQFGDAVASFDRVLELRPNYRSVAGMRRFLKMAMCDWRDFASDIERLTAGILGNLPLSGPMPIVALLDQPSLQHRAAQIWAREEFAVDHALPAITARASADRIRIGYFSADFREHAVAVLTAEVFETHDRSKFEVIAFSFGPESDDAMRRRLQQTFDRFIDVRGMSDEEVALLARSMGIDIAVDLSGYTQGGRTKIFAMRAAPIQINYLGYPGTMGSEHMDYLIGDLTVIPQAQQRHYSEKIVYLPHSYLPNDSTRKVADTAFTREQCGLPSEGFVFCCFNNSYKITPSTFDGWMRILGRSRTACFGCRRIASRCRAICGKKLHVEASAPIG
jgi:protein O-GlcNAc transferase